jgi:HAD superfamily hydrolase (TIGR01509 family)
VTPDLVIFDCDGVLVDSEPIINRAHAAVLTACGYPISPEALVARFCGISDPDMLAAIERERGVSLPSTYSARVGAMIEDGFRRGLTAIQGAAETLAMLAQTVCVASSSTLPQIRRKLDLAGLSQRFGDNLFSAAMVARGKPAPDLFLHAARRMGVAPKHCVVVEDSPAGVMAAVAAGMTAIGFCGGSHCRPGHGAVLEARGAAAVIADLRDLADAMVRSRPRAGSSAF